MNDDSALAEIHRLASLGRVRITSHAAKRMRSRGLESADVQRALREATAAIWQSARENWRVTGGSDVDGDPVVCIVDLEADVVVVTVF